MKPMLLNGQSNQSIHDSSSEQQHHLGTMGRLPDGRVFYYASAPSGAAIAVGEIQVARERVADNAELATATTSLAVGSLVVPVGGITNGGTAIAANQYREGYLQVSDGGGQGYIYRIKDHDAFSASSADGAVRLMDPVKIASDAGTTVSFIYNLYSEPQQANTDQADVVVGVACAGIAAGEFGWIQTWGVCPVICDEAIAAVGQAIVPGTSTAGAGEEDDTATTVSQEPIVGYNLTPFVDTEYQLVDLRIRA